MGQRGRAGPSSAARVYRCRHRVVIAGTWHREGKTSGAGVPDDNPPAVSSALGSPALGDLLSRVELEIRRLEPKDPMQRMLAATCIAQFERLMQIHWRLVEDSGGSLSTPFYLI